METLELRVDSLESILGQFIVSTDRSLRRLEREMREFKDEMREFKDEMREFKDEMREFKDEMQEFKDESEKDRKRMNRQWGDIANRLGTVVEDIVAPNIPGIAKRYFHADIDDLMVRRKRRKPKDKKFIREFDIIATWDNFVLLNETKPYARPEYVQDFIQILGEFTEYFPEYENKKIIPVFSTLYLDDNIIQMLTDNNIYAMGMSDDSMDLYNAERVNIFKR